MLDFLPVLGHLKRALLGEVVTVRLMFAFWIGHRRGASRRAKRCSCDSPLSIWAIVRWPFNPTALPG